MRFLRNIPDPPRRGGSQRVHVARSGVMVVGHGWSWLVLRLSFICPPDRVYVLSARRNIGVFGPTDPISVRTDTADWTRFGSPDTLVPPSSDLPPPSPPHPCSRSDGNLAVGIWRVIAQGTRRKPEKKVCKRPVAEVMILSFIDRKLAMLRQQVGIWIHCLGNCESSFSALVARYRTHSRFCRLTAPGPRADVLTIHGRLWHRPVLAASSCTLTHGWCAQNVRPHSCCRFSC